MSHLTKRVEDIRFLTGRGKFVEDIKLPNMFHAVLVRSPYSHAYIKKIDVAKAANYPGVVGVYSGREVVELMRPLPQALDLDIKDYCIAVDEVVYYYQPVAAVVAKSYEAAMDAAELVEVDYEPLQPVMNLEEALKNKVKAHSTLASNVVASKKFTYGDVDEKFSSASKVVEEDFRYHRHTATPLECYGIIADYDKSTGNLTIVDNCQLVGLSMRVLSTSLGISTKNIRIVRPDIGGGFGIKSMTMYYEPLIAVLSMLTGKPVKWIESRREHLAASAHGSERFYKCRIACDNNGKITALRIDAYDDVGAYVRLPGTSPISALRAFNGPYDIKAIEYNLKVVLTNKCPAGPSRGNGKNHHAFVLERIVERASQKLGLDPVEFRMQNLIKPEQFPYITVNNQVYDSGNYPKALKMAAELIEYEKIKSSQQEKNKFVGVGFSVVVDPAGANSAQQRLLNERSTALGSSDASRITIDNTGIVRVYLGTVPQGQGHETVASDLVSKMLGVTLDRIIVADGFDSTRDPWTNTSGTYSSRFAAITVNSLYLACTDLRTKLLKVASKILEAPIEILRMRDNVVYVEGEENRSVDLDKIVMEVYTNPSWAGYSLEGIAVYQHNFGLMGVRPENNLSTSYGYQVHAAVVEVDRDTGSIKILKYIVVDDCGRVLNHVVKEGQVHGGVFTGISAALYEQVIYDEEGQLLTASFADYLAPTATEIPKIEVIGYETPSSLTLVGSKGVGETGALAPQAAIINAIENALSSFKFTYKESCITPQRVWELIKEKFRPTSQIGQ